ncbi:MAG: Fe(2+)-trafficking protein [Thaumarchaeota archaeon]|nr:Fe(2+)-trafficking protein [Nitrososphaerota archaeon]MCY3976309.1 Fe(2+)-trafficking protein [Nitrososphaerota archaeon]
MNCIRCKNAINNMDELEPRAITYPCCNKCWNEWKEYRVIIINEMRLDLSMPDHRKVLKKNEKIFMGIMTEDGATIDFTDEKNRKPDTQIK